MKLFKRLLIVIVLVAMIAVGIGTSRSNANSIVSMSSDKVSPGTDFYLVLSIGDVNYSKFRVDITNSMSLQASSVTDNVSSLSRSSLVTSFVVDKSIMGLSKLGIVYTSPKEEGNISFNVKITNLDNTQDTIREEITALNSEIETLSATKVDLENSLVGADSTSELYTEVQNKIAEIMGMIQDKETQKTNKEASLDTYTEEVQTYSSSVEVKNSQDKTNIIDNLLNKDTNEFDKSKLTDKETADKEGFDKEKMEKEFDMEKMKNEKEKMKMTDDMKDMELKMSGLESSLKSANNTITSLSQGTTYKGSQNNYLQTLTITGVDFESPYKKTTSDYFATVDSSVTSVTVNATAEDSTAVVTIYGNTNLQTGRNKILINVTAEDGSIRTYRIYVTKS